MTTPQKFRKKPVEIEAIQFLGGAENATSIIDWVLSGGGGSARYYEYNESWTASGYYKADPEHIYIDTLEGTMRANVNDWVIRGIKGEHYPCKPDIMELTYDWIDPWTA